MKEEKRNDKTTQKPVEQMGLILPKFTSIGGNAFIFALLHWQALTEVLSNNTDLSSDFDRKLLTTIMLSWS